MLILSLLALLLVVSTASPGAAADGAAAPCEKRVLGQLYDCLGRPSDPVGICERNCMTAEDDEDGGFVFVERQAFGARTNVLSCSCGGEADDELPGARWFSCTRDDEPVTMVGKVAARGRRIRKGFTDDAGGAVTATFECRRAQTCTRRTS